MEHPEIWFVNLDIQINELSRVAFSVFGMEIFWYGVIIMLATTAGYLAAVREAVRTGQKKEDYSDYLLWAAPASVIGARLYYIMFTPNQSLATFLNFRGGGLAIYGVVIGSVITAIIFCKKRGINFFTFADTAIFGLIIGQVIGRWANFINAEAFGGFTDNLFALRYRADRVAYAPDYLLVVANGVEYIQVHPTFLYESMWNLALFIGLHIYKKHKAFTGELFLIYLVWYGIGRAFIETLRTDSLMLGSFRASVLMSIAVAAIGICGIAYKRIKKD